MTTQSDETDRTNLAQRLEAIRASAGLPAFDDPGAVLDAMNKSGVNIWFHNVLADADIADRLHVLHSRAPALFAKLDTRTESEAFRAFCGNLDWSKLPPDRKLALVHKFKASVDACNVGPADQLRRELTVRHGADESKWPNLDRSRLADLSGPRAQPTKVVPNAAQVAAINTLHGQHKLEALSALSESATLRQKIAAGVPGADILERRLQHLRHRFPTILAA